MPPKKRKKQSRSIRPRLNYGNFDPDIPVHDFFEHLNLDDPADLEEALDNFIFELENGYFFTWETVVCEEQALKLTNKQKGSSIN